MRVFEKWVCVYEREKRSESVSERVVSMSVCVCEREFVKKGKG